MYKIIIKSHFLVHPSPSLLPSSFPQIKICDGVFCWANC